MESIPPVNPDDLGRGPMIMGITWTFTILAMMAVCLRFYLRLKISKLYLMEDWFMLAAVVSTPTESTPWHHDACKT
jgi:hypothetical protein